MNTQEEHLQREIWWSGVNQTADEALNMALNALRGLDMPRCLAYLRLAMVGYGWEFHSDKKARSLWDKANQLNTVGIATKGEHTSRTYAAIGALYHATYRAVHFDKDRRIRRNMPPSDPAARPDVYVPLGGVTSVNME